MLSAIARNWWLVALRGALAVAYAFVDGIIVLSFGLMAAGSGGRWWPLVLGGIVGIAAGVLTFFYPGATALALVLVIGAWAIVTGVLEIAGAIRLRNLISNEWLMGLSGLLSIVFGALVLVRPGSGALALLYLFGFYAIIAGLAQLGLAFRLRGLGGSLQPLAHGAASPLH
jgi:uncharacterized membrane protein HdeD (DUF308 family)